MVRKDKKIIDVSVIVPTKNEEYRIEACLQALTQQKTKYAYEIIIIDTNSTDKTVTIAQEYTKNIYNEPRPGRNIARQTGTSHAKGSIICFTEADCIVPEHWIESIGTAFHQERNICGIVGRYTFINSTKKNETLRKIFMPFLDNYFNIMHGHYPFRASNCAITKQALDAIGGVDSNSREFDDVDLSMRLSKIGKILYLPNLYVKTEDRRINGRIFKAIQEGFGNYLKRCVLNQPITQKTYADIR